MTVCGLFLDGFRNYNSIETEFCEGINVITGRNAQGKTNLIETIYYLSSGKSFRQSADKELIAFNRDNACIRANIVSGGRKQVIEAMFFRGRRRQLFVNGVKLKNAGELIGRLTTVIFCPDDLNLIRDGASIRRKFMDNTISQMRHGYIAALTEFNRLYDHKTRILRDHYEKPSLLELLDDFNERIAQQSAKLIYYRSAFATNIEKRAAVIHNEFSSGQEELTVKYKTVGDIVPAGRKPDQLFTELKDHQKKYREAEIRSGLCLSGAHKDDLEIEINGRAARKYASQGQARTASVSLKLAEREIMRENIGESPVLLLDDVLSELDKKRQEFILEKIKCGQVFITSCDESAVKEYSYGKVLKVEKGIIT